MAGGSAGGGGYQFQAVAGAYVAAHALRRKPLGWLEKPGQDVPAALLAETGSGGDDWRIELDDGSLIEIECKRGLKRGERLWSALMKLAGALARAPARSGILLVDGTSTDAIKNHLPKDLRRIGQGRTDGLKDISAELCSRLEKEKLDPGSICQRLTIVTLDLVKGKTDGRRALELLERVVEKRSAQVAWKALSDECLQLIADRGRRDTQAWLHFLAAAGVPLAKKYWRVVALPDQQPVQALRSYLHRLVRGCRVLPLESVDPHTASDPRDKPDLTLDAIYTALLTHSTEGEHSKKERAVPDLPHRARRLSALEQAARYPRLVLLVIPAAGRAPSSTSWRSASRVSACRNPGAGSSN